MKLYFKKRDDGEIAYYSDKNFDGAIAVTVNAADLEKVKQNYRLRYTDKLEFVKPPYLVEEEKKQAKEDLKQQVNSATTIEELKEILNKII